MFEAVRSLPSHVFGMCGSRRKRTRDLLRHLQPVREDVSGMRRRMHEVRQGVLQEVHRFLHRLCRSLP